ncbi:MAG: TonB-dependent receptor [Tannerella sp.]|jgi:TonB-linked SusC/RagA family outer membrane protein|nr:TonB-dependent receptor [Tannerella sp.]
MEKYYSISGKTLLFIITGFTLFCPMNPTPAFGMNGKSSPIIHQVRAKVQVSGTITDKQGEPLAGATILDRASGNGTTSDIDGNFSISVSPDAVVEFSYIGYKSQEIAINGKTLFEITLEEYLENLDEIVVVGYGVQRKINLSGSVDQLNAKQLNLRPMSDLSKGLQGMIPNLNIDFASGEPGQAAKINIRGEASINGGSPLILIDGIASDASEMSRILPQDIESISVLKDASSAAIYGARAAFGVILITTKRGDSEDVRVDYNNNFAWKKPSVLPSKTSDPYIYLKLKNIAVLNTPWSSGHVANDERLEWARQRSDNPDGTSPVRLNPLDETQWEYMGNRDWTSFFLDKYSFSNTHQISVSGKTEKTRFYLSGGIENENGIMADIVKNDSYKRYSMRSKVDYQVWNWLTISNNTSYVLTDRIKPSYLSSRSEPYIDSKGIRIKGYGDTNMSIFYDLAPTDHDVNPDGTWANNAAGIMMAKLVDGGEETTQYGRIQSTFSAELNFCERMLLINANFTFMKGTEEYDWYKTKYTIGYGPNDIRESGESRSYKSTTNDFYSVLELFGTFNKNIGDHNITTIVGFNQEYNKWDWYKAEREGIISTSLPSIGLSSGDQFVSEQYADWAIRGLFFRAGYTYKNKYITEINGRYDGTSRFPENKRFGFFPSASLAWRIDGESFFEPVRNTINQLKIRGSYGSLGNQMVGEYGYIPTMTSKLGSYIIGGKLPQVVTSPSLVSPDYTWEEVRTINAGIDLGFMANKLTATFDIYRRDTKGMLTLGKELPGVLGTSEPQENAADMKTNGWELTIGYQDQFTFLEKPFSWGAKFILSDNRSWITKFDNPNKNLSDYYIGQELGEIWGLQSDGFFQNEEEIKNLDQSSIIPWGALEIVAGWPKYKDLNGDNQITKGTSVNDPGDLSIIGNSSPRFRFGFNLNAEWNGWDASAFLQGIGKRDYYPLSYLYWGFYQQPYAGGQTHLFDFYRSESDSEVDMAKHSQAYINAGLAQQNLNARYPVFQSWLADKNLGTNINDAMGLAIPQTGYLLNGAYLRIKNITLGYSIPDHWAKKIKLSRLRAFVSCDNLCEWSALKKYFDPESVTNTSHFGYVYPFNRQYSFGINATF